MEEAIKMSVWRSASHLVSETHPRHHSVPSIQSELDIFLFSQAAENQGNISAIGKTEDPLANFSGMAASSLLNGLQSSRNRRMNANTPN